MNDSDLERDLRSQRGPREGGYTPAVLPMALDDGLARSASRSGPGRTGLLVGVGLASALAVAVVVGFLSGFDLEVGDNNSPSPSAEASTRVAGDCARADLTFTAEPWGGAAGSRGTVVTIALAEGRYSCLLPSLVTWGLQDANGTQLVGISSQTTDGPILLQPGAAFAGSVEWSNWCGSDPTSPIGLTVRLGNWPYEVPVVVPVGGADPVPPCTGGKYATLGWTPFELQP